MKHVTVVTPDGSVTEETFHRAMVRGLERAKQKVGSLKKLARRMGLSARQLANILKGAQPRPKKLFDVLSVSPCALDDIARAYGYRLVPRDCVDTTLGEDLQIALTRVDLWLKESMHSESEMGSDLSYRELLKGEPVARDALRQMEALLSAIDQVKEAGRCSMRGHGG